MNVCIFIDNLSGGGAERVVANLSNYLINQGDSVTVLNYEPNESAYSINECVERDFLLKYPHTQNLFVRLFYHYFGKKLRHYRLGKYLKSNKNFDVFLVFLENPSIDLLSYREIISVPIIVSERNYPGVYDSVTQNRLLKLSEKADGYVFQTSKAKEWYGSSVKHSTIIPNALNSFNFPKIIEFTNRKKRIVSVGRLQPQKNHILLIEAFSRIANSDYILEIYGEGTQRKEIEKKITDLGLTQKVFLRGFSSNILEEIKDAYIFVLPSINEGIPNALIEAMALGIPSVTTDFEGGGAHTLILNGVDGLIVENGNLLELTEAILKLISDRQFARFISQNSIEKIKTFDPKIIYEDWRCFITSLLSCNMNKK